MEREKLGLKMSIEDIVLTMSEGNSGAYSLIKKSIFENEYRLIDLLMLDDMNIRGSQIWLGYKDYCRGDADLFWQCVRDKDLDMIEAINISNAKQGRNEKAVRTGASNKNNEFIMTKEEFEKFKEKDDKVHKSKEERQPQ